MNNELRIWNYYYWIRRFRILFLLGFTLNAYSQRASINLKSLPQLSNNPDSGLLVAQKWFLESYKNNDYSTQVLSLIEQSKLHYQLCEFDKAHVKLNQAILIANSTKNQDLILKSYLAKSDFYFNSIKKNIAFENHDLIVRFAKKSNDKTYFFFISAIFIRITPTVPYTIIV